MNPIGRQKKQGKIIRNHKRDRVLFISLDSMRALFVNDYFFSFHDSEIERFHFELKSWYLDYWIWCTIIKIDSVSIRKLPFLKLLLNKCKLMYTFFHRTRDVFVLRLRWFFESGTWCKCWIIPLESGLNSIIEFLYMNVYLAFQKLLSFNISSNYC